MAFVREKKIYGRVYYYLVKSVREHGRVKQINLEYLGVEKPESEEIERIKKKYEMHK